MTSTTLTDSDQIWLEFSRSMKNYVVGVTYLKYQLVGSSRDIIGFGYTPTEFLSKIAQCGGRKTTVHQCAYINHAHA